MALISQMGWVALAQRHAGLSGLPGADAGQGRLKAASGRWLYQKTAKNGQKNGQKRPKTAQKGHKKTAQNGQGAMLGRWDAGQGGCKAALGRGR